MNDRVWITSGNDRVAVKGLRWSHGEFVHWRKDKRRKRKLLLLNIKQRRIANFIADNYSQMKQEGLRK